MNQMEIKKGLNLQIGQVYDCYFTNGDFCGQVEIIELNDKSVFSRPANSPSQRMQRESYNTWRISLNKGTKKLTA